MKIDRHIPLPQIAPAQAKARVPVEQMELGDSILFPAMTRRSALGTVKATAMRAGLKHNYRSAVEGDGARVWRIA